MRQILLGKAPLGQGGAVGSKPRFLGPPYYLVNDTFTTDRSGGAVNGTKAEPGPGRRTAVDSNSKLSLSSGSANFAAGGVTNGDPGLWYGPQVRIPGRMAKAAMVSVAASTLAVGWDEGVGNQISDSIRFQTSSNILGVRTDLTSVAVGTFANNTDYQIAVILRSPGCLYFIKGGAFTNWTLLYISVIEGVSPMYPGTGVESSTAVGKLPDIKVPAALWLPTPLASDGFSSFGATDGLGHAEGVSGGLGSGGNGLSWTSAVGTWGASGGVAAASALSGGVAVATVDTGVADAIVTAKLTRAGGTAGVVCRWVDANNHVQARHTGTNAQLVKVVAGTPTTLIDAVATYSAGAEIRIIPDGQKFRLYYNNALIGSEQTIADATLASATRQGLRTTDTSNTFDDFNVYARGSGGEHAALDNF